MTTGTAAAAEAAAVAGEMVAAAAAAVTDHLVMTVTEVSAAPGMNRAAERHRHCTAAAVDLLLRPGTNQLVSLACGMPIVDSHVLCPACSRPATTGGRIEKVEKAQAWQEWPEGGIEDDGDWEEPEALSSTAHGVTPMRTPSVNATGAAATPARGDTDSGWDSSTPRSVFVSLANGSFP